MRDSVCRSAASPPGLSGVRLLSGPVDEPRASVELEEGQRDVSIGLEAVGNVPRYAVFCQK